MASKVCLGVITLAMVASTYFKIKMVYQQSGVEHWTKKYRFWIYLAIALTCLANFAFVLALQLNIYSNYHAHF